MAEDIARMKELLVELQSRNSCWQRLTADSPELGLHHSLTKQLLLNHMGEEISDDLVVFQDDDEAEVSLDYLQNSLVCLYFPILIDSSYIGSTQLRSNKLLSKKARFFILQE